MIEIEKRDKHNPKSISIELTHSARKGWRYRLVDFLQYTIAQCDGFKLKRLAREAGKRAREEYRENVAKWKMEVKNGRA